MDPLTDVLIRAGTIAFVCSAFIAFVWVVTTPKKRKKAPSKSMREIS